MIKLQRYSRQIILAEVGEQGQALLNNAKVVCVGAGGLASPALLYLAAAGIGTIGIIENDKVELSNLQRQILYTSNEVGKNKSEAAQERLTNLNPEIKINLHSLQITKENALELLSLYDVVIDCTDNFFSRYLINDACFFLNKPDIFASIYQFEGQCSVFMGSHGPCYRCLFDVIPPAEFVPNCAQAGVMGPLPGILGSVQAMEAIKYILGKGNLLIGRLLTINALSMRFREINFTKNPDCVLCSGHHTFEELKMPKTICHENLEVQEITLQQFRELKKENENVFLLDVREPAEYAISHLDGYLIPLGELSYRLNELDPNQHIVVHCRSGKRSKMAAEILIKNGFNKVSNLQGGILGTCTK